MPSRSAGRQVALAGGGGGVPGREGRVRAWPEKGTALKKSWCSPWARGQRQESWVVAWGIAKGVFGGGWWMGIYLVYLHNCNAKVSV